jgi:cytoskeletal protein RodZ
VGTEKRERQKANRALKHQQEQQAASRRKLYRKIAIGVGAVAALVLFVWIASNVVGDDDEPVTPVTIPATIADDPVDTTVDTTVETTVDDTSDTVPATTGG